MDSSFPYFGLDFVFLENSYSMYWGYIWQDMHPPEVAKICIYDDRWPHLDTDYYVGGFTFCERCCRPLDDLRNFCITIMGSSEASMCILNEDGYLESEEIE